MGNDILEMGRRWQKAWTSHKLNASNIIGDSFGQLCDEIERLRAGWQTIESAPKDGTEIILGVFRDDFEDPIVMSACWIDREERGGMWSEWHGMPEPTHWMPLVRPGDKMRRPSPSPAHPVERILRRLTTACHAIAPLSTRLDHAKRQEWVEAIADAASYIAALPQESDNAR